MKSPSCVGKLCETCMYQRVCDRKVDLFTYRKPREYIRREYCSVEISGESYIGELIRCKDCRYFSKGTLMEKHMCMYFKNRVLIEASEDGFCSRAEKKDEHSTGERITLQDISERIVDSITGAERKEE